MIRWREEDGSGTVSTIAVVAAVALLAAMSVPLYTQLAARRIVAAAADAAALAGADARSGATPGFPCSLAAAVAAAHRAELTSCVVDDLVVTVHVEGLGGAASARAGPPRREGRHAPPSGSD
ncbi:MAG: hypothetical protein JWP66_302 [Naasia sp.]|nr:hypothetical protein [Naasia sp.]